MRILYGITANGNGHLSRSRRIVRMLRERGHELALVISGEPGRTIMDNEELMPFVFVHPPCRHEGRGWTPGSRAPPLGSPSC